LLSYHWLNQPYLRYYTLTQKIIERSRVVRTLYLKHIDKAAEQGPHRSTLACGNLAHGFAACNTGDKADLASDKKANIAIISSYNDMLSAHEPYKIIQ
jgi:phosphogluconate dehydratase